MTFSFYAPPSLTPEQSGGLPDIIGNILKGYTGVTQARYLRPKLEEELQKAKLFNQYYGPNMESQIGLRGAQAGHLGALTTGQNIANRFAPQRLRTEQEEREFKLNNPFFGQTGTSGDVGRMLYLKQMLMKNPDLLQGIGQMGGQAGQPGQIQQQGNNIGEGQSYLPPIMQQGNQPEQHQQSALEQLNQAILNGLTPKTKKEVGQLTQHQKTLEMAANFDKAPADTKKLLIAQAAGMGISPSDAIKAFREKGKGIDDLAKEHGFDPEDLPDPIYPNSAKDISLIKQRQGALKELESIGKDVTDWAGDYSNKFMGFSPTQIMDAIKNKDPDKQAKFLAARALAQELSYLRLMVANGKATVHAIKNLEDTSLTKMRVFEPMVTTDVWRKMQKYLHESLERGATKSFEAYSVKANKKHISNALGGNNESDPLGIR